MIPADVGKLVDNPGSPWLQYLQIGGYAHFQSAFVDGSAGGRDFCYTRGADWRRVRMTLKAQMFDSVSLAGQFDIVEDEGRFGGGVETDYFGIFSAWVELDLSKMWNTASLDGWTLAYGKRKLDELNEEVDTSVNALLTVERSAMATQIAPFREGTGTTGGWVKYVTGKDTFSGGIFTTDSSKEFGDWQDGEVYLAGWRRNRAESLNVDLAVMALGAAYQDTNGKDELYSLWKWVATPWMRIENGRWGWHSSGVIGSNEGPDSISGGTFYGLVAMPTWWLIDKRLQAVMRYQVMGSDAPRGVQMNFRYAREAGQLQNEAIPSLAAGLGDFHQSIYGGVNWVICPKRFTMLFGLEWDQLESKGRNIYQGYSGLFAARVMF